MIVTVSNQKGGSGKTTLALAIAGEWQRRGHDVLIVDADPQGTARRWAALAAEQDQDPPPVVGIDDSRTLSRDLPNLAKRYERIVVDTPPRLGATQRAALAVADIALLPVGIGSAEVWALGETLQILQEVQAIRPQLRAAVVPNKATHTKLAEESRQLLKRDTGLPVLSSIGHRVAFPEAMSAGYAVTAYPSQAADEVVALVDELDPIVRRCQNRSRKRSRRQN